MREQATEVAQQHPAGLAAVGATLLVLLAQQLLGLDLTVAEATGIVALVTGAVSAKTPRKAKVAVAPIRVHIDEDDLKRMADRLAVKMSPPADVKIENK